MSQDAAPSRFLSIPLELRHRIYGFASQRPHPNLILKEYLEKTDPDVGPPQAAAPPQAQANGDEEEDEDGESGEQDAESEAMDEDEDSESEEQDAEGEAMEEDAETDASETQQEEDTAMTDVEAEGSDEPEAIADKTSNAAAMQDISAEAVEDESDDDSEPENEQDVDDGENEAGDDDDADEADDEEEEEDEDEDHATGAPGPQPVRRPEFTGRDTKYRHMLTTIKTRGCPPPIGLLLVNKQTHDEAMKYHYSTSFIEIDITAAFVHYSFFEETLDKFKDNACSPVKQIRKVKVTLTWDSEWLREKITPPDAELESDWAFDYYLNERIDRTLEVLATAPNLRHVEIDWHDTERTDLSERRMGDTLIKFTSLESKEWTDDTVEPPIQKHLNVTFRQHISEAGTAHARNSLLAKRRTEFDQILASGMTFR